MLFSYPQGQDDSAITMLKNRSLDVSAALLTSACRTRIADGVTAALYFEAQRYSGEWGRPVEEMFSALAKDFEKLGLTTEQHEHASRSYFWSRLINDVEYTTSDPFIAGLGYVNPFSGLIPSRLPSDGSKRTALYMLYPGYNGHGYSHDTLKKRSLDMSTALLTSAGRTKIADGLTAALYFAAQEYSERVNHSVLVLFPAIASDFEALGLSEEQQEHAHKAYLDSRFYGQYSHD